MKRLKTNTRTITDLSSGIRRGPTARAKDAALHDIRRVQNYRKANAPEKKLIQELSIVPLPPPEVDMDGNWMDVDDPVQDLHGNRPVDFAIPLSHAGGELEAVHELREEILQLSGNRLKDMRTRRDRTQRRTEYFSAQLPYIVDAYMQWDSTSAPERQPLSNDMEHDSSEMDQQHEIEPLNVNVIDIFYTKQQSILYDPVHQHFSAVLVRRGLFPSAPVKISVVVTTRTLQFFHSLHSHSPATGIQPFVRALCDSHGVPYRRWLRDQFSIAYDLFLQVLNTVDEKINRALSRDDKNWRIRNACPSCTYVLEDEHPLEFTILACLDGNNSLKRVARTSQDEDGLPTPINIERFDHQSFVNTYYLTRDEVNRFENDVKGHGTTNNGSEILAGDPADGSPTSNVCTDRWRNMSPDNMKRMWSVYDESGLFVALCRHGFVLILADMVSSGELAKYPLAVTNKMLEVFGDSMALAYDIGCQFSGTITRTSLAQLAATKSTHFLVPLFHGYAHNRLCQLRYLPLYVAGAGLEDFEGCERAFSRSNGVAGSTRYASRFHRQQAIVTHFQQWDKDKYTELGKFLINNYKQALDIINTHSSVLKAAKVELGITEDSMFETWLNEEHQYLESLKQEPAGEDVLKMEYLVLLQKLEPLEYRWTTVLARWDILGPDDFTRVPLSNQTLSTETERRHTLDELTTLREAVISMERKLGIAKRWTADNDEWKSAQHLLATRNYNRALDNLESLIVARLFELTKMNMSGTGYKLRTQIAKALNARSQSIQRAIERYNALAQTLVPPRTILEWKQVVEYTFLADFDLLRDTNHAIVDKSWSRPIARNALNTYFKLCRAHEETTRLNIEIRRLLTFMADEEHFFDTRIKTLIATEPNVAFQIQRLCDHKRLINAQLRKQLSSLSKLEGFSGTLTVGQHKGPALGLIDETSVSLSPAVTSDQFDEDLTSATRDGDNRDECDDEDDEDEVLREFMSVLTIADDNGV